MRLALTNQQGQVANVIVWPDDQPPPSEWGGHTAHDVTGQRVGPGWGHDPNHPARFAPPFNDRMLDPDPETGEVRKPGPVWKDGAIYDPDDAEWPPDGPPDDRGWKRGTDA